MLFIKILYSLFGIGLGLGILKYRKVVYSWTGKFYWAEKYLGSGGTVFVIIVTGLLLISISVAYPFGAFDRETGTVKSSSLTEETNIE